MKAKVELQEQEVIFKLPQKKIEIRPNIKATAFIKDVNHLASFLAPRAKKIYVTPIDRSTQRFKQLLTEDETVYLEKVMHRDLSIYSRDYNFWAEFQVILGKDPVILNLSDPVDFIKYKVLLANKQEICSDERLLKSKLTYMYVLKDLDEAVFRDALESDFEEKVWSLFGDLKKDRIKMLDFLRLSGRKVSDTASDAFLISEIKKHYIKSSSDNMKYFVNTLTSEDFDLNVTISKSINYRVIEKNRNKYIFQGEQIGSSLSQLLSYLKDSKNQDILLIIQEQIKNAE
jgi:hypothetical protein